MEKFYDEKRLVHATKDLREARLRTRKALEKTGTFDLNLLLLPSGLILAAHGREQSLFR